jgi:hypothetical protein
MIKISISRDEEWLCMKTSYQRIARLDFSPDHESRKDRGLSLFEYVIQMAQSVGAEMAVAKYFKIGMFKPAWTHSSVKPISDHRLKSSGHSGKTVT